MALQLGNVHSHISCSPSPEPLVLLRLMGWEWCTPAARPTPSTYSTHFVVCTFMVGRWCLWLLASRRVALQRVGPLLGALSPALCICAQPVYIMKRRFVRNGRTQKRLVPRFAAPPPQVKPLG